LDPQQKSRIVLHAGKDSVDFPSLDLPSIDLKNVELPSINLPAVKLPSIDAPYVNLPSLDLKSIQLPNMPAVDMDAIKLPSVDLPAINIPGMMEGDQSIIYPLAAAAVGLIAVAALESRSSKSSVGGTGTITKGSKQKKKNDLSIPYDAAAQLAYNTWLKENDEQYNDQAYQAFKSIYEKEAVAEATSKKLARDRSSFQNKAPPPPPKRPAPSEKSKVPEKEVDPFFFADRV
jgi:hypothetical protein